MNSQLILLLAALLLFSNALQVGFKPAELRLVFFLGSILGFLLGSECTLQSARFVLLAGEARLGFVSDPSLNSGKVHINNN